MSAPACSIPASHPVPPPPVRLTCPLTCEIFIDPVIDPEGHTYERAAIETWLQNNTTSPLTRNPLRRDQLVPNRALTDAVHDWMNEHQLNPKDQHQLSQSEQQLALSKVQARLEEQDRLAIQGAQDQIDAAEREATDAASDLNLQLKVPVIDGITYLSAVVDSQQRVAVQTRTPVDICCVVDVSGSMGDEVLAPGVEGNKAESSGLTRLDLTKHALRTVAHSLGPRDRLALVSFHTEVRVHCELTTMDDAGRARLLEQIEGLEPLNSTNLWGGLQAGMELMTRKARADGSAASEGQDSPANSAIFLLTDGLPNVEPPRGHVPTMRAFIDKHGCPFSVHAFGFGYSLDSKLLGDLARIGGNGSFAFIPDSGFVGTIFINALAGVMSSVATQVTITIDADLAQGVSVGQNAYTASADVCTRATEAHGEQLTLTLGRVVQGQARHIVLPLTGSSHGSADVKSLRVTLKWTCPYTKRRREKQMCLNPQENVVEGAAGPSQISSAHEIDTALLLSLARVQVVDTILTSLHAQEGRDAKLQDAQSAIVELCKQLRASRVASHPAMVALLQDVETQVTEAFSRPDYLAKWGRHYLPSLAQAHLQECCNNFKDAGVQVYGGPLFKQLQEAVEEFFMSLPAPKPSIDHSKSYANQMAALAGGGLGALPQAVNMRRFYNSSAGCFSGDSMLELANGSQLRMDQLHSGMKVRVEGGETRSVLYVQRVHVKTGALLVRLSPKLALTPWHPFRDAAADGAWRFPCMVAPERAFALSDDCSTVYNLVLDPCAHNSSGKVGVGSSVLVGGIWCSVLGHGMRGAVIEHKYFGSQQCVKDISRVDRLQGGKGIVDLHEEDFIRDDSNVVGIRIHGHSSQQVKPVRVR